MSLVHPPVSVSVTKKTQFEEEIGEYMLSAEMLFCFVKIKKIDDIDLFYGQMS